MSEPDRTVADALARELWEAHATHHQAMINFHPYMGRARPVQPGSLAVRLEFGRKAFAQNPRLAGFRWDR